MKKLGDSVLLLQPREPSLFRAAPISPSLPPYYPGEWKEKEREVGAATFLHVVIVVLLRLCLPRVCHLRPPPPPPSLPPFHFDALSHLLFRIRALLVFRGRRRDGKRCLWGIPPSSPANSASRRILLPSIEACVRGRSGRGRRT